MRSLLQLLCSTAAATAALSAQTALAQSSARPGGDGGLALQELVVTATRREDTINRVPLSVTALNQQSLETLSVRSIDDIRRLTPGLGLTYGNPGSGGGSDTNISIRGIASNAGASTTGVYLDDIPIHKTGSGGNGYGAPYPKLFDVERVEVLRGPQGTLYGGSTEGGAVRFITPAAGLQDFSGHARVEGSRTRGGDPAYEAGVAVGGPIVRDTLGFRLSGWFRREGGYVDHVSRFTGRMLAEDTNDVDADVVRGAITWAPVAAARITAAVLVQKERRDDQDLFWENIPTISAPAIGFTAAGQNCNLNPITNCARLIPATTYPAYNMFGPYKSGGQTYDNRTGAEAALLTPRLETLYVPSLTLDYDFPTISVKSITGYVSNKVKGVVDFSFNNAPNGLPAYPANEVAGVVNYYQIVPFINNRRALTQEIRFSSKPSSSPLSWVAGVFFTNSHFHYRQTIINNQREWVPSLRGVSFEAFNGFTFLAPGATGLASTILIETSQAAYGEANYQITAKLKATAGLRYSRDEVTFRSIAYGLNNTPAARRGDFSATVANGGIVEGQTTASSATPKVGLTYQIDPRNMVYTTVAKGYRPGGFNSPAQSTTQICQDTLRQLGLSGINTSYEPDYVWSYEGGAKMRLFEQRLQLNSSIYRIDWTNIQQLLSLPNCGLYTANASQARSQGFDIQAEVRVARGFTLSGTVGHTDAKYRGQVVTPTLNPAVKAIVVNDGDPVPGVPKWSVTIGAQYEFSLATGVDSYIRADYSYAAGLYRSTGPGTTNYTPDIYKSPSIQVANLRAGVRLANGVDVSLFGKNIFDSRDRTYQQGGSTSVRSNPVIFSQTFRPREIGLTASYRY